MKDKLPNFASVGDEKMSYADAVIFLRMWEKMNNNEFVTKAECDDFVRAMFIVYGGRR